MASVGHMVTMSGVLAFYFMLLDSHLECKMFSYLHTIVPRFNKRALYYIGKIIHFRQHQKMYSFVPSFQTQKSLLEYNHF